MCRYGDLRHHVNTDSFNTEDFTSLPLDGQKNLLLECLDHNHLYVNLDDMDDTTYKIGAGDRRINRNFYDIK